MDNKKNTERPQRRSPIPRNRRQQGLYLTCLLLGTVVLFLLLGLLIKDRTFSEKENRNLAQAPKLNADTLSGYLSDLSEYTADQFPGRDLWIRVNLWLNQTLGQSESSGVYLCKDDYLMQIPGAPNDAQLQRNLEAINAFAQEHPQLNKVVTIVPNAVTILSDKLPTNAPVRDQRADLEHIRSNLSSIRFLDVTEALLAHKEEPLFYKTDHHWTSLAAYYAFQEISPNFRISAPSLENYTRYTVSDSFAGTLSSRSGSYAAKDQVEIFVPDTQIEYYVTYSGKEGKICSLYDRSALETKDHYTVFFGGNYPRVDITTSADTGRVLLLFKDSYANCMVQFLYPYFDHITMIDPRYYYDNLENVISSEGVTDVLFLYNLDTFLSDSSLADVLSTGE